MAVTPIVQAAGVLLWRRSGNGLEVGVVHRPKYDDWSLPKGKVDLGEHLLTCAIRETLEETGHAVALGRPLPVQRYPVDETLKVVHYWAARADPAAPPWPGTSEIDQMDFVPATAAAGRLTHPRDADLVAEFTADAAPTVPLIVLRHGKAMPRAKWSGADDERPLDSRGTTQAYRLAVLLSCYQPERVVTSDAVRCVDTVRPYATVGRRVIETDPRLSEHGHEADGDAAADAMRALLADGRSGVVCSHRPVLPAILDVATAAARCPIPREQLSPGAFVVLHCRDGVVVAAERHTP